MSGSIILLLGGIQGIILSAIIYSRKKKQQANKYLGWFVFLLGIGTLFDNNIFFLDQRAFVIIWLGNSFLFGPLLFLYISHLNSSFKIRRRTLGEHFSIFLIMKTLVLSIHFAGVAGEPWTNSLGAALNLFLVAYNVGYAIIIFKVLKNHNYAIIKHIKWVKAIVLIFASYSIFLLVRRILYIVFSFDFPIIDNYLYLGVTLTIYWMSYQIINEPGLISRGKKYEKSGLHPSDVMKYGKKISEYLESSKAFKQSNFNLAQLSQELEIPKHQLSQILNEHFDKTFYQLIHEFRVKEVRTLLESGTYKHLSILGIASECGFQSKSAFNKAFRTILGTTPSQYIRMN